MIRKFKALGLVFVAVLAMSALGASAAQATPDLGVSASPASVHGTGEGVGENFFTDAGKVTCKVSHYTGTATNGSSTVTLHPTYTECTLAGIVNVTITTTGCDYLLHLTQKTAANLWDAHADIVCEAGKTIKIAGGTCKAEVGPQTGLTTIDVRNSEPTNDVTIQPTIWAEKEAERDGKHGPIKYTVTEDGFLCPFTGTGATTGGEYSSEKPITGTAASGTIEVTGE